MSDDGSDDVGEIKGEEMIEEEKISRILADDLVAPHKNGEVFIFFGSRSKLCPFSGGAFQHQFSHTTH